MRPPAHRGLQGPTPRREVGMRNGKAEGREQLIEGERLGRWESV
jgi:hypothetical protein